MIVSVGEVVWDIFSEDKQVLGGAPINVAYHLSALLPEVRIITRIGDDELGQNTMARLGQLGLNVAGVQLDATLPTGRVKVTVDGRNEPHFDIVAPVAWDNLDLKQALQQVGEQPFALVYGTLAQRDPRSRAVISALCAKADKRFYDVNLRPPYTSRELVLDSLQSATLIKMNEHELAQVAGWLEIGPGEKKNIAQEICKRYDLDALAVTEGGKGAWLVSGNDYYADAGQPVQVADTVGAGDAFFAGLIAGYLQGLSWPETLSRANRRGGYVAGRHGATPAMPKEI
ncbi:MAG: carbohydrate kinase [Desulfobulbaceae bacterium]|nr:carbohydrate kinase [Desulfobulbaceae bacterium]HIJ79874.1 carbohydrate kinase [Deltaproteobacteria bacterium]